MTKVRFEQIAREVRSTFSGDKAGVPIVGLEHITPNELLLSDYDIDSENTFTKAFKKGQILFGRRRAYQQKAAVATFDGICSGDITVIEPIEGTICPRLLPFIIQNEYFFEHAVRGSAGSLSPRVKWEHLASYEVELPNYEEQVKLSNRLWTAYNLKTSYNTLLSSIDEMVKSQFIEMLKGKAINGTISDLVAPKIANVKKTYSPDDTIQYIDISSINAEDHSVSQVTEYSVKDAPSRAQQCVKYGDLLVSTVRPINRNIAIVDKDLDNLVASTGFCVLRPNDGMLNYLLSIVLSDDYTDAMCDKANGGVYPAVNNGDVLNYQIHIPDDDLAERVSLIRQQADKSKFDGFKSQFTARNYFHMHETELHTKLTEAICRHTDGSRTDGKKGLQLPFPVMRFDVNLPVTDHSEVASDTDSFTRLFLTDYCKVLSRACFCEYNFHDYERLNVESKERLKIEYSIRLDKNRTSTQNEINVLLYSKHESLPPLALNYIHNANILNIYC